MRLRTGFSFRKAVGLLSDVMERVQANGWPVAPITDRASTFGFAKWEALAQKSGLRPVFGIELAVVESVNEKKPAADYWTFLAIDELQPLHELLALATRNFRYEPLLSYEDAQAADGLIKIVGHRAKLDRVSPGEGLYYGLGPATAKGHLKRAMDLGLEVVATTDNYYPNRDDLGFYEVVCGRGASTQSYDQHIQSDDEWVKSIEKTDYAFPQKALALRNQLWEQCKAEIKSAEIVHPKRPGTLRSMCEAGAERLGCDLSRDEYADRLTRELTLIAEKKFEDYFYIVADLCRWARQRMAVGPARGSSCGSLVCYLLGITTVDPIPHNLLFERFIDVNRPDLPDIDIDFSDQNRHLVFEYLSKTYGDEHVARLGTVAMYKARSALQEAGAALRVPRWKCDAVADAMIKRSSADSRAADTLIDTLEETSAGKEVLEGWPEIRVAGKMEGHPRHYCLKWDTEIKVGQTNHILKGKMTIKALWEIYIGSPSADTARARRNGKPRMPVLVSMEDDQRCRPQKALNIWPSGKKRCIKMTFSDGSEVECSRDHKFLIDGAWKPCGDADIGSSFQCLKKPATQYPGRTYWLGKKRPEMSLRGNKGPLLKGERHPNYKGGIAQTMARQKEERSSPLCDDCQKNNWQDLHHNDHSHGAERPEDVNFLCKSCHRKRHGGENKRWKNGLETEAVKLERVESIGLHQTFDIEMPVHHNFVLGNGIITSNSQHAAGAILASEPISKFVAVDHRTNATMCDKGDAENRLGLLKIDILGLTQLSVLEDACSMAGMKIADLEALPLDDQPAFDVLNRGEFSGIFQWNGNALQSLTKQITVDRFDDIVAISALARPGPLATGGSTEWTKRRMSGTIPAGLHPKMDELTNDTFGIVVYQEQVMFTARKVGLLSWEDTTELRRAMSKGYGNEFFDKYKKRFVEGACSQGVDEGVAVQIWDQINTFGSWAFNRSHAVAYGMVSYWCCWMKAHHPFEFAAATLTHESDPTRQIEVLREMAAEGYDYVPFDIERSTMKWTAGQVDGKRVLIGPLTNIKGCGPRMAESLLSARARNEPVPERVLKLVEKTGGQTEIDSLFPITDAIQRIMPDPAERNINTPALKVKDLQPSKQPYEAMIFCTPTKINPRDENEVINVQKRDGQRIEDGLTDFLQVRCTDDTGTVMGKINRFNFPKIGQQIIDKGRPGKSLWAFKGKVYTVGDNFLVFSINKARYIGDIDDKN
jgi:DNA polymerase III alpha subunit